MDNIKKNLIKQSKQPVGLLFIALILVTGLLVAGITYLLSRPNTEVIRNTLSACIGAGAICFTWKQSCIFHTMDYENDFHLIRFCSFYFMTLILAVVLAFLPYSSWIYLVIMITLSLMSNALTGLTAGLTLLMITVNLSQSATASQFILYFIVGLSGILLFQKIDEEYHVGIPTFLSLLLLLLCETAYVALFENSELTFELFFIPCINIFINAVLLLFMLKVFSTLVIHRYRDKYLEINDPEFVILVELKKRSKESYYQAIHSAYLSDKIAKKLSLCDSAAKGGAYYYRLAVALSENNVNEIMPLEIQYHFPPQLCALIEECVKKEYHSKESCIVMLSDQVIFQITKYIKENNTSTIPYQIIIDDIFRKAHMNGNFKNSQITLAELSKMKDIFLEEKLYYDFLR